MNISKYSPLLLTFSGAWLGILFLFPDLLAPRMAFWGTTGFIVLNFLSSLFSLVKFRQILVWLNLIQPVLFCMLSYQLFLADGPQNYRYDHEPILRDWVELTAVHLLRAVDILDGIEAYGLDLQNIEPASTAAGLILVSMHLTVDLFLISLVFRGLSRYWSRRNRQHFAKQQIQNRSEVSRILRRIFLILAIGSILLFLLLDFLLAEIRGWSGSDGWWWLADQFLRVVDIGDACQIFQWRLHESSLSFGSASVAVTVRFLISCFLAKKANMLRMKTQGLGLTVEELFHEFNQPLLESSKRASILTLILKTDEKYAGRIRSELLRALADTDPSVRKSTAEILGNLGPVAVPVIPVLVERLTDSNASVRQAVAEALGKLGPSAQAAIPELITRLSDKEISVCDAASAALGEIGDPAQIPILQLKSALMEYQYQKETNLRAEVAKSLKYWPKEWKPIDRSTLPNLSKAMEDSNSYIRKVAEIIQAHN